MRSNFLLLSLLAFVLAGCADAPPITKKPHRTSAYGNTHAAFYEIDTPIQCVPYAREKSGIQIYGDAHTWWAKAAGRYQRGALPQIGSVMVLSKTSKLKHGHLAVVTNILGPHQVEVTHSNWGNNHDRRCVIYNRMRVQDISRNQDWSLARFWNYELDTWGLPYAVSGFIYP
jgi:surface antigen